MSKCFDIQILMSYIDSLKKEGRVYNDTDFCQKVGIPKSYISDLRAGRKELNESLVRKIRFTFPDFLSENESNSIEKTPSLGDLARMIADHDRRFHDQMERIMDAMGVGKKEAV